jgi:hypothetical protein
LQNKINLPTKDITVGNDGVISGWGRTNANVIQRTKILQKATMKILSNSDCEELIKMVVPKKLVCGFQKKGIGLCYVSFYNTMKLFLYIYIYIYIRTNQQNILNQCSPYHYGL